MGGGQEPSCHRTPAQEAPDANVHAPPLSARPRSRSRDSGDENDNIQERHFRPHFLQAPGDLIVQEGRLCRMDCKVNRRRGAVKDGQSASFIDKVVKFTPPTFVISEASGCRWLQIHRSQWSVFLVGATGRDQCSNGFLSRTFPLWITCFTHTNISFSVLSHYI